MMVRGPINSRVCVCGRCCLRGCRLDKGTHFGRMVDRGHIVLAEVRGHFHGHDLSRSNIQGVGGKTCLSNSGGVGALVDAVQPHPATKAALPVGAGAGRVLLERLVKVFGEPTIKHKMHGVRY